MDEEALSELERIASEALAWAEARGEELYRLHTEIAAANIKIGELGSEIIQLYKDVARTREALKTLFEGRGLSYNAAGEASCNWCERWDKDGLGEEYIEHLSGCPFTALSPTAGMEE